jgi:hypothetical protein
MKLRNENDVRTMFSIFGQYNTKEPIELDISFVRFFEDIRKNLIWTLAYEEIRACMEEPDE